MTRPRPLATIAGAPATIAYLGNSVTAQRSGYANYLHRLLCRDSGHEHRAVNAGFGGVGAIGSVCTMDTTVIAHRPTLCFIECLTGDIGIGPHPQSGAAVEGMLAKLDAIDCTPCILLLPRAGMEDAAALALAEHYRRIARHHGVALVDLLGHWADPDALLRDGVHPSESGAAAFAAAIMAMLADLVPLPVIDPVVPLFDADFSGATTLPVEALGNGAGRRGLFRLHLPYRALAPGEAITGQFDELALVGLLVTVGPHAGAITVNEERHQLRDRWAHYERLHAHILRADLPPRTPWRIAPVEEASELRLVGLLTRPARPGSGSRRDPAGGV